MTTAQVILKRSFLIKTAFVLATGSIGSVYEAIREGFIGGCEGVDFGFERVRGVGPGAGYEGSGIVAIGFGNPWK